MTSEPIDDQFRNKERQDLEKPELSILIPIKDEQENISALLQGLAAVLDDIGRSYEVIAVNDGSSDGTEHQLRMHAEKNPKLRVINFRRNYGQTAAMMAAIDFSRGDILVSIDADLQNDPQDIPLLLDKLDEGNDVVSGWRKDRKDAELRRNLPSRVANSLISKLSGVKLNDFGCTLKAYRSDVIRGVNLYGEMHRFIPMQNGWARRLPKFRSVTIHVFTEFQNTDWNGSARCCSILPL